ncbi:MAG: DNA translocase FtsK, partial [Planctomycetota bacterium]
MIELAEVEEEEEYEWEEEEEEEEEPEEEEEEEEEEEWEEEPEPEPLPVAAKPKPKKKAKPAPAPLPIPRRRGRDKTPMPSYELLEQSEPVDLGRLERSIKKNAGILERSLASFRIETRVVGYTRGPVITMYELALKEGTKLATVVNRSDDLAIALKAESVRIVAPIPGKNTIGVEVPNPLRDEVNLRGLLEEVKMSSLNKKAIPIFFGRDAAGSPMIEDLAKMPHLLIAGATGSGKSVCINTLILSVLMTRRMDEVRLILVDPKQVELAFFKDIPHLLTPVVTDPRKAAQTLDWIVTEMEDRYRIFALFGVRNIASYNALGKSKIRELAEKHDIAEESAPDFMPYLVVVVDELADLIMTGKKDVEQAITRLAQKSRAVGIHSVLATQRPSTDVITGLIKANMPSRASFKVTSKIDSRVVLDQSGAEKLLGMGDMLFLPPRSFHLVRAQGCYASDEEVRNVVSFLR